MDVELGYNPTHLDGWGDKIESLTQAFNGSVSDFDLNTILMQMHDEVHTRKLLLVGHSQGTFYTNEIYRYLITHGMSPESVAVYNIATPASSVAGAGRYVTSTNDKVINEIRDAEVNGDIAVYADSHYTINKSVVASPLRSNITIAKENGWATDDYGGHHFSVYMNGAGDRITSDISRTIAQLKPGDSNSTECFQAPSADLKYHMQAAAFTVSDPVASAVGTVVDPMASAVWDVTATAYSGLAAAGHLIAENTTNDAIGSLFSNIVHSSVASALSTRGMFAPADSPGPQVAAVADATAPIDSGESPEEPPKVDSVVQHTPAVPPATPTAASTPVPSFTAAPAPSPSPDASPTPTPIPTAAPLQQLFQISPGFGGGGGSAAPSSQNSAPTPTKPQAGLSVTSPADNAFFASTSVDFIGTGDAGVTVSLIETSELASTTADGSGNWSLRANFLEGTHVLTIKASLPGHTDNSVTRAITIDTMPPATTTISIAACAASLSSAFCFIPSLTTDVSWASVPDADHYGIAVNGIIVASTTAASQPATLVESATSSITIVSYDAAGNSATSSNFDVYAMARPLIINEIGWAGDGSDPSNQWIELKNVSPFSIDLSRIQLTHGGASIQPTGTLASGRAPYETISRFELYKSPGVRLLTSQKEVIAFDLFATSTAEQLSLVWNGTAVDATPAPSACSGWCTGGFNAVLGQNVSGKPALTSALSMERVNGTVSGADPSNWQTTDSYGPWLGHSNTASLWGTPNDANSYPLPEFGIYCDSPSSLLQAGQPFSLGRGACTYLMRFITGSQFGANRDVILFRGTVGSSTSITSTVVQGALAATDFVRLPADMMAGEPLFFAIFEERPFGTDLIDFENYFEYSASTTLGYAPPHGNYVTLPFTYQP